MIDFLMKLHIAAGTAALATFLVPMVTAKGGKAHRRAGWVFVAAMATIFLTGMPVSAHRLAGASTPGAARQAVFLLFITLLSGSATWKGIRVLGRKGNERNTSALDILVSLLLITGGLFTAWFGWDSRSPLLLFFGPFGVLSGAGDLRYWLNPDKPKLHWFFAHMAGMMGASIAALTAFLVLGSRTLGLGGLGLVAWIAPTLVFVPVSVLMGRYYRRKFKLSQPRTSLIRPRRFSSGSVRMASHKS